jgi:phage terminase large subunit-like protein
VTILAAAQLERWRDDPVLFVREVLRNPETGLPFDLYQAEETFLRHAFRRDAQGRLLYPELVYAAPKKSGKTAFGAILLLVALLLFGGKFAEGYACANDLEQAAGRVFAAVARIVQASPLLRSIAKVYSTRIDFPSLGATVTALASDAPGAAGADPVVTVFDELWGYTSERAHRLWDEMVPPPTRTIALRVTVTYAGFQTESDLLEGLYKQGLQGEEIAPDLYAQPGMLMFWTHDCPAPWQTEAWREQMRRQLRPNAYLRMIENRFVSTESSFVEMAWWDACVDPAARPIVADRSLEVCAGVDASVKRDSTAIDVCRWNPTTRKVELVWHRVFQPSKADPLNFEATIEEELLKLAQRFRLREVYFDPFQMIASAQRLQAAGVMMTEFPQSVPNLTEASQNLYDLIKGQNLVTYPDGAVRTAVNRCVAIETSRGWRITKEKASHKIDVVVALAQAALACVRNQTASCAVDVVRGTPAPSGRTQEFTGGSVFSGSGRIRGAW